jgi:hypothetical protein
VGDALHEVVDYDFVREVVRERVGRGHIRLQETLADDERERDNSTAGRWINRDMAGLGGTSRDGMQ